MTQLQTIEDIKQLGTIMGVWAHPDDETFSSAGIMAAAVSSGQRVVCVTATRGEMGVQDESRWPAAQLGVIREAESKAAFDVLGVKIHHWLDYRDGLCADVNSDEAASRISTFIERYKPDTILTFGPDGMTGHSDHQAMCTWTRLAVERSNKKPTIYHAIQTHEQYDDYLRRLDEEMNIFFNIDKPLLVYKQDCAIYFELPDDIRDKKYRALKVMPSQTEAMLKKFEKDFVCRSLTPEAFVLGN